MADPKFLRLNNTELPVSEETKETKVERPVDDLFDINDRLAIKGKKSKKRKKLKKELRREKLKLKKLRKSCEKTKKEMALIKQDISRLRQSGYDSKLKELIACNDTAERKKIAAELKRIEV